MKKNFKSVIQKILIISFIVLAEVFGLYALIKENTLNDSLRTAIREDASSGVYTVGRLAFDGDEETYWALEKGKKEGQADRYFSEEKNIEGISARVSLAEESRLCVMREKEGALLPYENGVMEGPFEGVREITFCEDARFTGHVVFKVEGEKADECRIYEINVKERADSRKFGKITPKSCSFNQKEYINIKPERLWDGYVNETWYEPLWYIPWEIQQSNEGRSGIFPDFNGHPTKSGEIIWELDGTYKIEVLKAYFGADWRSVAFEFWNGEKWGSKTELGRNSGKGWFRKELSKAVETQKIRITFPLGWEGARYINQIEVWGEGVFADRERKVLFEKDGEKGVYRASISGAEPKGFEADILTEGYDDRGVSLKINEDEKNEKSPSYTDGKRSVYTLEVKDYELRGGTQFIEINTYGKELKNITVRNKERDGRIKLGGSYSDKNGEHSFNAKSEYAEKEFILDRKYSLEKIRIYAECEDELKIDNGSWNSFIKLFHDERGFYEADLGGMKKERIKICSRGDFVINEVELYGSPVEDGEVRFEIWSSQKNTDENSCLLGWIGNPVTLVTADENIHPRQADNLFWLPVRECGKNYLKKERHEIKGELYGKASVKKYRTKEVNDLPRYLDEIKGSDLALSIELPYDSIITQKESIIISGIVGNGEEIKVFIKGRQVETERDFYREEIALEEGENTVSVEATDITGRKREKTVRIIRDSTAPEINIIEPVENQYINTGTVKFAVDGKEEDLWWQFNDEEWERGYGRYKYKDYEMEDGFYTYSVRVQDRAGNISGRKSVDFCMDKTLPDSFEIKLNVEGWTNNNTPEALFETTDATSGIDHYEYKIDDNNWQVCESPLQTETLKDGKRTLYVRAIDRASNIREESVMIYVDTSCPPIPENLRLSSNKNSIFVKWNGLSDNSAPDDELTEQNLNINYFIERKPEWQDGSIKQLSNMEYGPQVWEDSDIKKDINYSYRIWAVDKAGNESEKTQWKNITAGFASVEIEDGLTYIEFDGLAVSIPENALSDDIIKIQIHEVPQNNIPDYYRPINPLCSEIYSVITIRSSEDGEIVSDHADLNFDAVLEVPYKEELIPTDYSESEITVFYYDDLWGAWLPMRDCYIDTEDKVIRCKTNHFTDFSVQATKKTVLTEVELKQSAYDLNEKKSNKQAINISGEDGGLSVRFEEMFFPGKNGLDLSIQRIYSTGNLIGASSSDNDGINIDGGRFWTIASGWRINMPYMKWNGCSMVVYGMNGLCSSIDQMSIISESSSGKNLTILMESHEYSDLKIELNFEQKDHYFLWWKTGTFYKFIGATLFQNDGRRIIYGNDGKVLSITDCTGKNSINFSYSNSSKGLNGSINVTDSYGRNIIFNYTSGNIKTIKSGSFEVTYTTEKFKLTKANDVGGRDWIYEYETKDLEFRSELISVKNTDNKDIKKYKINVLTGVSGPSVGYTKIDYKITNHKYNDEITSDGKRYEFEVSINKLVAISKTEWISIEDYENNKDYLRKTDINIIFAQPLEKNIFVEQAQIFDGKTTVVTKYETVKKYRNRISLAPEAIRKVPNYSANAANSKNNIQILTYAKEIFVYEGCIDKKLIQKETYEISEDLMRIINVESIKGANKKNDTFIYDEKGNLITEKHIYTNADGNVSGVNIDRTYTYNLRNHIPLPANVLTTSWHAKSQSDDAVHEFETISLIKSEYNSYGQIKKSSKGSDEKNLNSYVYLYQTKDGLLKEIISPENNHTLYSYKYGEDNYTTTVTYKDIEGLTSDKTSVSEIYVYDNKTGNLIEQTDCDGYITLNSYDNLGRITEIRKFHEKGEKGDSDSCTVTKAIYDDAALTTTVTDGLGAVTVNTFDGLGRLIKVVKSGKTTSDYAETEIDKAITIKLEYDNYDCVTKMTEPSYKEPSLVDELFLGTTYSYDAQNRLIRKTDADNNILEYIYDDKKGTVTQNIKKLSDGAENIDERKVIYKDYKGNVFKESLYFCSYSENKESEKVVNVYYDGMGRKVCQIDPNGNKTEYKYNFLGKLSEVIYPDGIKETKTYNNDGYLIKNERRGETESTLVNYKVNGLGFVIEEECPVDNERIVLVSRNYDGRGNIITESVSYKGDREDVRTTSSIYDWNGNIISQTDGEINTTIYKYDKAGNLISVTDPRQNKASYKAEFQIKMEYDSFGRIVKGWLPQNVKRSANSPEDIFLAYNAQGNCIYRRDNEELVTQYDYTNAGLLKEQTTGDCKTSYEYNGLGNVVKVINPDGTWKKYSYNSAGQLIYEYISGISAPIQYKYDINGNLRIIKDRSGTNTEYEYDDKLLHIIKENMTNLSEKSITYDKLGRVISEADGEKNLHAYEYDNLGRVVKETVNTKPETVLYYEYDARGNLINYTDAAGTIFKRKYSKTDLLLTEEVYVVENGSEVLKETRNYSYDEAGALKAISDENNTVYYNGSDSNYQPDAYGNTIKEKWSRTGLQMEYEYDTLNRLVSVKTPDGKQENYEYNKNDQVSVLRGIINGSLSYSSSKLEKIDLECGLKKNFSYNEVGLISNISYFSDSNTSVKNGLQYLYDTDLNITQRINTETWERDYFSYDWLNRLESAKLEGNFYKKNYEYFEMENLCKIDHDIDGMASETKGEFVSYEDISMDENGKSFVYDFKESKEIQKIELFKKNLNVKSRIRERDIHVYLKDSNTEWKELTFDNWNYYVDSQNQSIHLKFTKIVKTRYLKIRTVWDDRDINNKNIKDYVTFKNDSIQRMIRIWTVENKKNESYKYDKNSNRISIKENGIERKYQYYKNASNGNTAQVMYDGKWWYTYDANGNRTAKSLDANQDRNDVELNTRVQYWTYTWDYHNRLIKAEQHNAPDNGQNVIVEYEYDALNRRIERTSRTNGEAEVTQYAYGRNGALTYQKKTGVGISRTFIYLNNQITGFLDKTDDGTKKLYYTVTDIQGSVTEVYDEEGGLVWKAGYTAFGIKAGETTKLIDFDGLYTGCDYDAETGLTYHWNRWRSEDGDSWLSEDPARDGLNWYGYAGQNPTTYFDRNGLEVKESHQHYYLPPPQKEEKEDNNDKNDSLSVPDEDFQKREETSSITRSAPEPPKPILYISNVINQLSNTISPLFNCDGGFDYRLNAENAFQNGKYVQWFLYNCDGIIEATLDVGLIPALVITSKIDKFCQDHLGLGLAEMAMTLQAAGLIAPAGEALYYFSGWARAMAAGTGSTVVSTATNVGVGALNQAAGLVGINGNTVKLNAGQQGKHIKGHNNYKPGKSILYGNLDDAQGLLNKYAGTGQKINEHRERVNFGKVIGEYVNPETGEAFVTTKGIIHYGDKGAHIIPSRP